MPLSWLESILISVVQGISSVLPLSESGFTAIARKLLGLPLDGSGDRLLSSILHIFVALVILATFRKEWIHGFRYVPVRRGRKPTAGQVKAALGRRMLLLMAVGFLFQLPGILLQGLVASLQTRFMGLALILLVGGLLIFSADRVGHGRRTVAEAAVMDAFLVGLFQSVGMIPGLSSVGLGIVMGIWLGMEPSFSVRFSCLLLSPGLILRGLLGILACAGELRFYLSFLPGIAACVLTAYLSLRLLRYVSQRRTLGGFSMPVWGAAVFSFILYLFS